MKTLSIYIPTWERPEYLSRLLASIEYQMTDDVEVFVSVNAGSAEYKLPNWVQHRKTRINIGGDANIITGPSLVSGKYVWVIGDDDQLLNGAIKTTLRAINDNPGLIIHLDGKFKTGIPDGTVFPNYGEFCKTMIEHGNPLLICAHTLISANTFSRAEYDLPFALQRIDSRYGFHYGMLKNILDKPVHILEHPTMKYDNKASIFQCGEEAIAEHMAAYPQVIYDIFAWVKDQTGVEIPHGAWGRGFV